MSPTQTAAPTTNDRVTEPTPYVPWFIDSDGVVQPLYS